MDAHKNFAYSTVATAPAPALTGLSLVVATGEGARLPTPPFNAVVWPAGALPLPSNAEVVRVTAGAPGDTQTILRAQEGSSARTIVAGDQIMAAITAKALTDIEAALTTSFDTSMARMYRAAAFNLTSGQTVKVPLDTAAYDYGSNLNVASSRYVAPSSGLYTMEGCVAMGSSSSVQAFLAKNGVPISGGSQSAYASVVADAFYLAAGDYVELFALCSGAVNLAVGWGTTYLTVARAGVGLAGIPGASGVSSAMQQGAVLATDAALTINSTSSITIGTAGTFFVQNAGGVLTPVAIAPTTFAGIPAAATYTRLDVIVVDSTGVVSRLAGAESNGVTLANRTGAQVTPVGSRLLYDILVTTGGVLAANVRDRRPWARGAFARQARSGTLLNIAAGNYAFIDSAALSARVECSGVPVRLRLAVPHVYGSAGGGTAYFGFDDSGGIDGMAGAGSAPTTANNAQDNIMGNDAAGILVERVTTPSIGSHLFRPIWAAGSQAMNIPANAVIEFTVEEICKANANNGVA